MTSKALKGQKLTIKQALALKPTQKPYTINDALRDHSPEAREAAFYKETCSKASRMKMAAAQRARWARVHAAQNDHAQNGTASAKETKQRRFVLDRDVDATGTSGTGIVAEGVQFSNGQVVIHWLSQLEAINVYANALVLEQLHGHGGNTQVKWIDP